MKTISEVVKSLREQCEYDIFKTRADYHDAGKAADLIEQQQSELETARARIEGLEAELKAYKKHGLEPCDYAGIVVSENQAKEAQDDLLVLMKECTRLQSHDKEAMELLDWAFGILQLMCGGTDTAHLRRYEAIKARQNETRGGDTL